MSLEEKLAEVSEVQSRIKAHREAFEQRMKDELVREQAELHGELLAAVRKARQEGAKKSEIGRALGTKAYITYNAIIEAAEAGSRHSGPGYVNFTWNDDLMVLTLTNYHNFVGEHGPITGVFAWKDESPTTFGGEALFLDVELFGEADTPLKRTMLEAKP